MSPLYLGSPVHILHLLEWALVAVASGRLSVSRRHRLPRHLLVSLVACLLFVPIAVAAGTECQVFSPDKCPQGQGGPGEGDMGEGCQVLDHWASVLAGLHGPLLSAEGSVSGLWDKHRFPRRWTRPPRE